MGRGTIVPKKLYRHFVQERIVLLGLEVLLDLLSGLLGSLIWS